MKKFAETIKHEVMELLPPSIFFFIALHLVAIIYMLMLKGTGIRVGTSLSVTIAALVLGKSVLIADMLPFINRYPTKPLAYNVAWKTLIYTLVSVVIHYLEHLIDFWRQTGNFAAGNRKLLEEIVWPHFWAIQILLFIMIFEYCTMHELFRVAGRQRVQRVLFGTPSASASETK